MDTNSISLKLYLISDLVIQEVKEAIRSGELSKISLDATSYPDFDVDRTKQLIFAYHIANKIQTSDEYKTLVFEIIKYKKRPEEREHFTEKLPNLFLVSIVNKMLEHYSKGREIPNEDLSNKIENYIDDFIRS